MYPGVAKVEDATDARRPIRLAQGEAIPPWRDADPLTTRQVRDHRLSGQKTWRLFYVSLDATDSWIREIASRIRKRRPLHVLKIFRHIFYAILVFYATLGCMVGLKG